MGGRCCTSAHRAPVVEHRASEVPRIPCSGPSAFAAFWGPSAVRPFLFSRAPLSAGSLFLPGPPFSSFSAAFLRPPLGPPPRVSRCSGFRGSSVLRCRRRPSRSGRGPGAPSGSPLSRRDSSAELSSHSASSDPLQRAISRFWLRTRRAFRLAAVAPRCCAPAHLAFRPRTRRAFRLAAVAPRIFCRTSVPFRDLRSHAASSDFCELRSPLSGNPNSVSGPSLAFAVFGSPGRSALSRSSLFGLRRFLGPSAVRPFLSWPFRPLPFPGSRGRSAPFCLSGLRRFGPPAVRPFSGLAPFRPCRFLGPAAVRPLSCRAPRLPWRFCALWAPWCVCSRFSWFRGPTGSPRALRASGAGPARLRARRGRASRLFADLRPFPRADHFRGDVSVAHFSTGHRTFPARRRRPISKYFRLRFRSPPGAPGPVHTGARATPLG